MRYFVLLSALLTTLWVPGALAQEVSGSGHLQLASGDSLHGEIRVNARSGEVWILTADGAELEFQSTQLAGIEIGDRAFIPTPKIKYASSSFEASPPALMNVVVEGPATLLSAGDNDGVLFLATRDGIAELRATDEKRYDELRAAEAAMHFHSFLHRHAGDCLTIVERINFLPMDRDRIIDYVRRYNACIDPVKYQYRPSFGRKRLQFRLAGAIAKQSSEHFAAETVFVRRVEFESDPRTTFQAGFGVELQYPDDRRGRSFDAQFLIRSYSFTDERDEYIGGCRTDSPFGCPTWDEGEYKYYLNHTHYHVADVEAMFRFLHPIVQRGITPKVGVGVLVQVPIRREIESSGTMTYRPFGPNPEYTYTPIEIGYRTGRTVLQTPVLSLVVVHGRFSLDVAAMRLMRGLPRYEEIAPAKAGYLMTRATVGIAL